MRNRARSAVGHLFRFVALLALLAPLSSHAADLPRRIAIAPFSAAGQDDVRPVAALLPRLVASRLMALASVDAPVLAPSDAAPADAAKAANAQWLLQGSVARLGKGYSIDVSVSDLAAGKPAGAFFAAAATEDDIIPQVGVLSREIAEKLFDVKPAPRPQPAAAPQAAPAPAVSTFGAPAPPSSTPAAPAAAPVAAATPADWSPTAFKKLSQSDKIADEVYGVATISAGQNGDGELVAWGRSTLYFYRVAGGALTPWTRISRPLNHHFLNVDAADLDGDGANELLVTDRVGERMESFVLKRRGDAFEEAGEPVPYFLAVLPDRKGKRVVAGQRAGVDTPFQGKFRAMDWSGGKLAEGEVLPVSSDALPMAADGVLGLSAARLGDADRFLFSEEAGYLRVLDESGKTVRKGKAKLGWPGDAFEWGPYSALEGRRARVTVRQAPRLLPWKAGTPLLLAVQMKNPGILSRIAGSETEGSRLALFQWEDGEFVERAASKYTEFTITGADLVSPGGPRRDARVVAAVIEQPAGMFKERVSRLQLLSIE